MTEWILASEAVRQVEGANLPTAAARNSLMNAICRQLVKARAFRKRTHIIQYPRDMHQEIMELIEPAKYLDEIFWPWGSRGETKIEDWQDFCPLDAFSFRHIAEGTWHTLNNTPQFRREVKAEWGANQFCLRTFLLNSPLWEGDGDADGAITVEEIDFYSLEIEKEAVGRILAIGAVIPIAEERELQLQIRNTKFDWEAAFADVAARFYHDLQFEDLEARGVQREIIDALRQSFEERKLEIPSDDTLKPKARKILGALRSWGR